MASLIAWLAAWWPTVLICLGLAAFVALLVYSLVRDKKKGRSCCGGCGGCAMNGACSGCQNHPSEDTKA